jgi:hypothetical protein
MQWRAIKKFPDAQLAAMCHVNLYTKFERPQAQASGKF